MIKDSLYGAAVVSWIIQFRCFNHFVGGVNQSVIDRANQKLTGLFLEDCVFTPWACSIGCFLKSRCDPLEVFNELLPQKFSVQF